MNGTIPEEIFKNTALVNVLLGYNDLTGELSWDLSSLPNLRIFNITRNNLFGNIPLSTFDSRSLESLDLSHNEFQGKLAANFEYLTTLKHLYLEENDFDGTIPTELARCNLLGKFGA